MMHQRILGTFALLTLTTLAAAFLLLGCSANSRVAESADSAGDPTVQSGPTLGGQIQFRYNANSRVGPNGRTPLLGDIPLLGEVFAGRNVDQYKIQGAFSRNNPKGIVSGSGANPLESAGEPDFTHGFSSSRLNLGLLQGGDFYDFAEGAAPATVGPPQFTLNPDEELWVIQRPVISTPSKHDSRPGCGALMTSIPIGTDGNVRVVPVPLKHTEVSATISGYIATTDLTQQFYNPYDTKIEAVYVFPLPQNAAVNEFIMTIGDRKIRGIIREREEAERIYHEARRQGYTASLLTQERPNIFTQRVANIEPGKQIDINIKYFNTLAYRDGWMEYVFPMVVGPRFNPPHTTDGVGAVARNAYGASNQKTEVQYLRPTERSGHDISLNITLNAGVPIERVESPTHTIAMNTPDGDPTLARIRLENETTIPNKDFILRYKLAGNATKPGLLTHVDERGGFFSLMLIPPEDIKYMQRSSVEMIFVIDCSGSMSGQPLTQAKHAVKNALNQLQPDDSFQIIRFSNTASTFGSKPLEASFANVRRGLNYIDELRGDGGTMMINGIKAALDFPHDRKRLRIVCFLTDGFIGNETDILEAVHDKLGDARIFSFGVGSSPNRYLLERMAKIGRGAVAFVGLQDDAAQIMDMFIARASHPAMTDLKIDWGGMKITDVYPKRLPDLFVGRPVIITGRFRGSGASTIRITGKAAGEKIPLLVPFDTTNTGTHHESLPQVWARNHIADMADKANYASNPKSLAKAIKELALEYDLMSAFTAFVAVDSLTKTEGSFGTTVAVPVSVPEGVKYDTTVTEQRKRNNGSKRGDDG